MTYLEKAAWPAGLAMYYPYDRLSLAAEPVALSVAILAAVTGLALWQARARPWLAVGWLWFLVTLLPVLGIIQVGNQAMADRYTYVPLIGPFVALAWGAGEVAARWPAWRWPLAVAAGVTVLSAAWAARAQAATWRDDFTLYGHAIEVTERNWTAWNNLAYAYHQRGAATMRRGASGRRSGPGPARPPPGATWGSPWWAWETTPGPSRPFASRSGSGPATPPPGPTWAPARGRWAGTPRRSGPSRRPCAGGPRTRRPSSTWGSPCPRLGQAERALEAQQRLARLDPALAERLRRAIEAGGAARRGR